MHGNSSDVFKSRKTSNLFFWLWCSQLISNLGTQTSLYGIGLWLFDQSGSLFDFGLVAVAVQLARLFAPVLFVRVFSLWAPGQLMLLCHAIGAACTALLAFFLLGITAQNSAYLPAILAVQGIAAVAEAVLVVRMSSLIPLLIPQREKMQRANGLFAVADGLVITIAPFLGTWLIGVWTLVGVLLLDGVTFALAFLVLLIAPWRPLGQSSERITELKTYLWRPTSVLHKGLHLWRRSWKLRSALLFTSLVAFVYASLEILFPAWVLSAYSAERMGMVLILGGCGYLIGFLAWQLGLCRFWWRALPAALLLQALILMGAGLQHYAHRDVIWLVAFLLFSCGLPIVSASVHQAWVELAPRQSLSQYFSLRYSCEWSLRLLAFFSVPIIVDRLLAPVLDLAFWPDWLLHVLGTGPGRLMAIAMGGLGWLIVFGLWMRSRLLNGSKEVPATMRS